MSKRLVPLMKWAAILSIFLASAAYPAPYAAIVVDAETGEVLHEYNADMLLHAAGLTKFMTLYVAFEAIETKGIGLDDTVAISRKAQGELPVRLGLRNGQKIKLLYLLRATGVKGANDAATALAEGIAGSEDEFVRRLNEHSEKLGLARSS